MDALDFRYAKSVILKLLEKDTFMKSELFAIVTSNQTLDKLLDALEKDGYVSKISSKYGRRTYSISLTDKGRVAAEQLKRIEEMAKEEPVIHISDQEAREWAEKFREATKNLSLLYHVNVFEDHVTIGEEKDGKLRVINVYVKLNGKGIMRLWCEKDESFECIHVKYAWTLPKVQEMYANNVRNGKVKS